MAPKDDVGCTHIDGANIDQRPPLSQHTQAQPLADAGQIGRIQWQMHLRSSDALDQLLVDLYTPGNPRFGQYLTPAQFRDRFHPSAKAKDQLRKQMQSHGLRPQAAPTDGTDGLMVYADGSAQQLGKMLGTTYGSYAGPHGKDVIGPAGSISQAKAAGVRAVGGTLLGVGKQAPRSAAGQVTTAWTPAQLRAAYQVPASASAKDVSIGVIALEGYDPADIAAYCKQHGIKEVPRRHVFLDGFDGKPHDEGGQTESSLDIQVLNALVPDAKEIVVYGAKNRGNALTALLTRIANPLPGEPLVRLVSCSWGAPESQLGHSDVLAEHDILRQFAAMGMTLVAASGDLGAYDDGTTLGTDTPAAQPFALSAGGTSPIFDKAGAWIGEKGWKGSGGGVSCFWPSPQWQRGPFAQYLKHEPEFRQVPDWAAVADPAPGYAIIVNGKQVSVGGTSAAAPLLTAVLAMVEQARLDANKGPLGFAAPALYRAAQKTNWTIFNDIILGDNSGYTTSRFYDNVTGCGSPKTGLLIKALAE